MAAKECYTSTVATVHGELKQHAARRCQLVVVEGPDMGRAVLLDDGEKCVGSDAACDLVLHDDRVSSRHAAFQLQEDGVSVRDLGSRNGTIHKGTAIQAALVPLGSTFKLGRTFLRLLDEPEALEVTPSQSRRFGDLVAESLAMREVFAVLELAAASEATILLEGETGTGKELAARAVHDASERRRGPFVAVDCGAIPEGLLESELFGHKKGAFTGALTERKGAFLRAAGGTIFIDELDSVPLAAQARLLRVIEEREVRSVGSDEARSVDVRIVAAARRSLRTCVAEGSFRADLFYRLSVICVRLPPLHERREDIAPIVSEILRCRGFEAPKELGEENLQRLQAHDWPGNVRELRNVIDRALALSPTAQQFTQLRISLAAHEAGEAQLAVRSDLGFTAAKAEVVEQFERRYLRDLLQRCEGNVSRAAREAELDRKHLRTLLKRHELL